MEEPSAEQLILLDIFIYLDFEWTEQCKLKKIINYLLENNNLQILIDNMQKCLIRKTEEEWRVILNFIKNDDFLMNSYIIKCTSYNNNLRVMNLLYKNIPVVIFRGTAKDEEWIDNGKGAYLDETLLQKEAVKFIEESSYKDIIVSGHSKGGNMAQFAAVLSDKVKKCISINGQGFSREFIEKHKHEIYKCKNKITCINCKYDYVNCLLENISEDIHFIDTEKQINPLLYHKCDIMLDEKGKLRKESKKPFFNKIINDFSISLLSDLPKDIQIIIFDSFMEMVKCVLCREKIENEDLFKYAVSIIIVIIYGRYFKYKESISLIYLILEVYIVPFFLWGTFIESEEDYEINKYNNLIEKIKKLEEKPLKKIEKISSLCEKKTIKDKYCFISSNLKNTVKNFIDSLSSVKRIYN